jgi:hypothetical protein
MRTHADCGDQMKSFLNSIMVIYNVLTTCILHLRQNGFNGSNILRNIRRGLYGSEFLKVLVGAVLYSITRQTNKH